MCSKLAPPPPPPPLTPRTTPRIRAKTTLRPPPSRKTRSKTRKPKYLSLRLELSQDSSSKMTSSTTTTAPTTDHQQKLNLFPLHPENLVDQDRLLDTHDQDHSTMAATFFSAGDDGAATTLTDLLSSAVTLTSSSDEDNLSPSSLNYGHHEEGEHNELVRAAMRRNNERDQGGAEEKWVRYSEVVEEVSRSSACRKPRRCWNGGNNRNTMAAAAEEQKQRGLSLKLDYDEIMNAWSDKGPLYINHSNNSISAMDDQLDSPQTVPDLLLLHDHDDDFFSCSAEVNNGIWRVPEMGEEETKGGGDREAAATLWECWEWKDAGGGAGQSSQREASVQRYKEKRQNRLFAKTIRYQVRKLNAEKRPRIKGRFVKRSS